MKKPIKSIHFNQDEIEFIFANYKGTPFKKLHEMMEEHFQKEFKLIKITDFCSNYKLKNGVPGGRFEKGHKTHNKGKTWDEYISPEGQEKSRKTTFKKGSLNGFAKKQYKPVGTEVIENKDGYIKVKVNDDYPPYKRWKHKHRIVWEEANGEVPKNHCLIFLDGDRTNCDLDNLKLIHRGELVTFNKMKLPQGSKEITEAGFAIVKLTQKIYSKNKEK